MMNIYRSLLLGLLIVSPFAYAQDPVSGGNRLQVPPTAVGEVPLIPEQVPQNEKPRGTALDAGTSKVRKSKTSESASEQLERVRFRETRTKAERDPQIQAEWTRSQAARTDFEKREALKSYYKLLYARMAKMDGTLKKLIDQRQHVALRQLAQTRVDPTEPLDPQERAERFARGQ